MECVCPLIEADIDYTIFGGLQNPCDDSPVPKEGGYGQNTGGAVLANHTMDSDAVRSAWEAVALEFGKKTANYGSNDVSHVSLYEIINTGGSLMSLW